MLPRGRRDGTSPACPRFTRRTHPECSVFKASPGADVYFGRRGVDRTALIEEFLTGARPVAASNRKLATVLFTDIVGLRSERCLRTPRDEKWREQLDRHDDIVRDNLDLFRGRDQHCRQTVSSRPSTARPPRFTARNRSSKRPVSLGWNVSRCPCRWLPPLQTHKTPIIPKILFKRPANWDTPPRDSGIHVVGWVELLNVWARRVSVSSDART